MASLPPPVLRWLARLVVRGPGAPYVLGDLDESYALDLERGHRRIGAARRYVTNALGSAASLCLGRLGALRPAGVLIDVKLGLRMLARQPVLTLVSIFALAVGIPTSLIPVHVINSFQPELPFDEGDRILGIQGYDQRRGDETKLGPHEFEVLREEVTSYQEVGAARSSPFNVISEDGRAAPVRGAEMSASAFALLRVPPLLGRTLVPADETPGAPDVAVIGWDLWQSRLAGDPNIVGTTIRVGRVPHEVVGVMPEGFLFPVRDHLWLPLRARAADIERGQGRELLVFGRLAEGASMREAQAELSALGERLARAWPDTHGRLLLETLPFTLLGVDFASDVREAYLLQLIVVSLLVVVCGNIGTLTLARVASRTGEIAVRTALGASRARIVGQLFIETLVLALLSTGLGLVLFDLITGRFAPARELPFWFDFGMNARTALTALPLAVLCAAVAGAIPALKATGKGVQRNLQRSSTGLSGIRFGGLATALIVAEVALSMAFLTGGMALLPSLVQDPAEGLGVPVDEYLSAQLRMPDAGALDGDDRSRAEAFRLRLATAHRGLKDALAAEPGVRGFALAANLPGMEHRQRRVEVEGEASAEGDDGHRVFTATVDVDFFQGLEQPILAGRDFTDADLGPDGRAGSDGRGDAGGRSAPQGRADPQGHADPQGRAGSFPSDPPSGSPRDPTAGAPGVAIVNASFVEQVLGGQNPIGRRVRSIPPAGGEPGPWSEIVGVVGHLGMNELNPERDAGLYLPAAPGRLVPVQIAVRVGADPASFTPRLREIAWDIDPDAIIQYPEVLANAYSEEKIASRWAAVVLGFITTIATVLSAAGLYALMSFTVAERRREIGIRTALGALPGSIVLAIARRALLQLIGGVLLGVLLSGWLAGQLENDSLIRPTSWPLLLGLVAGVMLAVGMAACVAPTLRGLGIRPVEALKEG